jgi:hypothetical protein
MDYRERSEIRDGMRIDWDMPIAMEDGVVVRCDIYRPVTDGKYPVLMTYGPYGKWLHFDQLYKDQWRRMCANHPDVPTGSTNKYQNWEVVDPEKWVPDGYVCIRVDSRGAGRSPGTIDIWSLREAQDFAQCIEWAGVQPWSNGKVGLNGISYYAMNQWQTAALQPKHLEAICTWEGAADFYRDMAHHGGIFCVFARDWSRAQVATVQHGLGTRGFQSRLNGDWVSGPETLGEEQLGANRRDFYEDCLAHKIDSADYWRSRMPNWSKDTNATRVALHQFRDLGVRLSLDDFGTGYSSLSYLHSFPLHKVKIDRSFLDGIETSERSLSLLRGVARLSTELGMSVVMEGVETEAQLALIKRETSINEIQGFLFSAAVPSCRISEMLFADAARMEKSSDQSTRVFACGTTKTRLAEPRKHNHQPSECACRNLTCGCQPPPRECVSARPRCFFAPTPQAPSTAVNDFLSLSFRLKKESINLPLVTRAADQGPGRRGSCSECSRSRVNVEFFRTCAAVPRKGGLPAGGLHRRQGSHLPSPLRGLCAGRGGQARPDQARDGPLRRCRERLHVRAAHQWRARQLVPAARRIAAASRIAGHQRVSPTCCRPTSRPARLSSIRPVSWRTKRVLGFILSCLTPPCASATWRPNISPPIWCWRPSGRNIRRSTSAYWPQARLPATAVSVAGETDQLDVARLPSRARAHRGALPILPIDLFRAPDAV